MLAHIRESFLDDVQELDRGRLGYPLLLQFRGYAELYGQVILPGISFQKPAQGRKERMIDLYTSLDAQQVLAHVGLRLQGCISQDIQALAHLGCFASC